MPPTELEAGIERNKQARKLVGECLQMIDEVLAGLDGTYNHQRLWELLLAEVQAKAGVHLPKPVDLGAMSATDAHVFANSLVPWGKHKDQRVRDVPPDYWVMLTESAFYLQLRRFVATDLFQMLQD